MNSTCHIRKGGVSPEFNLCNKFDFLKCIGAYASNTLILNAGPDINSPGFQNIRLGWWRSSTF